MEYNKERYKTLFNELIREGRIVASSDTFKVKLFLQKSENSLLIAKHHKEIVPALDEPKKLHWDYWAITISYYTILYAAKAAIHSKGFDAKDHLAAQIALGHLLVPDAIEKEDLEILDQAHKIFEDDYIKYFEDARKESHIARYSAMKTYTQRRVEEIFENAQRFVLKIKLVLER